MTNTNFELDNRVKEFVNYQKNCLIFKINNSIDYNYICNDVPDKILAF